MYCIIFFVEKQRTKPILSQSFPKNRTVRTGSNITFECRELISSTLTDYRWLKWYKVPKNYKKLVFDENGPETNSSEYKVINPKQYRSFKGVDSEYGVRLILTNVTQEDAGLYTCLVSNHIGANSRSAFLFIDDRG